MDRSLSNADFHSMVYALVNGEHVVLPSGHSFDAQNNDYSLLDVRQWYDQIKGNADVRSYALLNEIEEYNKLANEGLLEVLQERVANIQAGNHLRIEMPVFKDMVEPDVAIERCNKAEMVFVSTVDEVSCNLPQALADEVKKVEPGRY